MMHQYDDFVLSLQDPRALSVQIPVGMSTIEFSAAQLRLYERE